MELEKGQILLTFTPQTKSVIKIYLLFLVFNVCFIGFSLDCFAPFGSSSTAESYFDPCKNKQLDL